MKKKLKRTTFEFAPKDKSITIRISDPLLNSVQAAAENKVFRTSGLFDRL